jgi:hypothetical protein
LCNIVNQINIAHHTANQALNTTLILDDQELKRPLVTRHGSLNQHGIAVWR